MKKALIVLLGLSFCIIFIFIKKIYVYHPTPGTYHEIRIGVQDNMSSAIIFIAKAKGFFKKKGFNVTLKKYPSGKLAMQGMFRGEVDFATASGVVVTKNSFERSDYAIVTSICLIENSAWIIARKDHGILTIEDLKGKKIATQKASAVHFFLDMFLIYNQIHASKVHMVFLPAVKLPQALMQGQIDAFSMRNPYIEQAKKILPNKTIEFHQKEAYIQHFNLISPKNFIRKNPQKLKSLIQALYSAEMYIKQSPEKSKQSLIHALGHKREKEIQMDWGKHSYELTLEQSLLVNLDTQAQWSIKNKFTTKKNSPNYLNYIYVDALKSVNPHRITFFE